MMLEVSDTKPLTTNDFLVKAAAELTKAALDAANSARKAVLRKNAAIAASHAKDRDGVHTVVTGDTLADLAEYYYGDRSKYTVIFKANQPLLTDPSLIYEGQVLTIPATAD